MRQIIAITQVTLTVLCRRPVGPEEDPSNGFTHGGWAMPFGDDGDNPIRKGLQPGDKIRRHAQPHPTRLRARAAHRR
jgi:hypothetical protein